MMMLIPEAWEHHEEMDPDIRAFYQYHACLMEPWDGPAMVLFSDGRYAGATLDRNGLRPSRYAITHDGYLILGSEAGTLEIPASNIQESGRLRPGRMLLVDLKYGRIVDDDAFKKELARRKPYRHWIDSEMVFANRLPLPASPEATAPAKSAMLRFGWTREEVHGLLMPMAASGKEAIGSMGRDTPLAVLSSQARPLFDYFSQQFAQVTNPPLDAIREQLVTSLQSNLGGCRNLFEERAEHARVVQLQQPVVTEAEITMISSVLPTQTIATVFDEPDKQGSLEDALDAVVLRALEAVDAGTRVLVLSDVAANSTLVPIPALLALGAVHHALVDAGKRLSCSLIVDSGEIREVHHVCLLIGYGASAVRPRLALQWARHAASGLDITAEDAERNVLKALSAGLLKVMSKMGISTVHSYRGAQLFEAVGLGDAVINRCFKGTVSRLGGVDFDDIAADYARFRERSSTEKGQAELPVGGHYTWRRTGEKQGLNPGAVANLQLAVRTGVSDHYDAWATSLNTLEGRPTSLGDCLISLHRTVNLFPSRTWSRGRRLFSDSRLGPCRMDPSAGRRMKRWQRP